MQHQLQKQEQKLKGGLIGGYANHERNQTVTKLVDAGRVAPLTVSETNFLLGLSDPSYGLINDPESQEATSRIMLADGATVTRAREEFTQMLVDIRRLFEIVQSLSDLGMEIRTNRNGGAGGGMRQLPEEFEDGETPLTMNNIRELISEAADTLVSLHKALEVAKAIARMHK